MFNRKLRQRIAELEQEVDTLWAYVLREMYSKPEPKKKPRKKPLHQKVCDVCGKTYKGVSGLAIHKARAHGKNWSSGPRKK